MGPDIPDRKGLRGLQTQLTYDIIIIGAGIVGAATARALSERRPTARFILLEKEDAPARHQTGRNSGVVHAGVYYEPGSLKARFCREGIEATRAYCAEHGLPYRRLGKLLVATHEAERPRMRALYERCRANGLDPLEIDTEALRELEPAVTGIGAILVEPSAITDYGAITGTMLKEFTARGGEVRFGAPVTGIEEGSRSIRVSTPAGPIDGDQLVVCGGLQADRLARLQGLEIDFRIIPYRGEYFRLRPGLEDLVRHLVYPIPDPALPFLGVHLTPDVWGGIRVGPNAIQGWKREGYGRFNFDMRDTADILGWPGFWRLSLQNLGPGLRETRNSLWKRFYLREVRRYCPQLQANDLLPCPPGVRAQAVLADGTMVHDFLIERTARSLHVCNAPSPAATAAIPIARHICTLLPEAA
jgi:L-2-hydroxyglutarate oxidase